MGVLWLQQIASLHMMGHNVILVSSGSIPIGKMVLHRQYLLSGSMQVGLCPHRNPLPAALPHDPVRRSNGFIL